VSRGSAERDEFVAVGDEVPNAGVALVLVDERQSGVVDCVFDAEGTGTKVTDDRLVVTVPFRPVTEAFGEVVRSEEIRVMKW